jgi:hypothetical protein
MGARAFAHLEDRSSFLGTRLRSVLTDGRGSAEGRVGHFNNNGKRLTLVTFFGNCGTKAWQRDERCG